MSEHAMACSRRTKQGRIVFYKIKVKVKVSYSLTAVGAMEVRVPLYLGHS